MLASPATQTAAAPAQPAPPATVSYVSPHLTNIADADTSITNVQHAPYLTSMPFNLVTAPPVLTPVTYPVLPPAFGAPPYPHPPFYGAPWPPQEPPSGPLGWSPAMQLSAYPPAYPMYYAPQTAVDYHSLGKNEPTIAWLRLATEVCEANRKPPNIAALRTNNVLCLSGARETQIASAIEGFWHSKAALQAFSAAFLAAAGDDQQSLAAVRYQRFSFRATVTAGAQVNFNAFKSMVND